MSYIVSDFPFSLSDNSITHTQVKHVWVSLSLHIPPDTADMATTEASTLENVDIIICIGADSLALYSVLGAA